MEQSSFTDSDGVSWTVREEGADDLRSSHGDSAAGTTWLRFESELEVRRLWHYPDDWRGLSPLQLETLLDRASVVIARFRSAVHRPAAGIHHSPSSTPAELRPSPPLPARPGPDSEGRSGDPRKPR